MTSKEHLAAHDKQIAAIRALIHEGMRLVIETRKDFRTIAAMQKTTAANLEALTQSMRGSHTNGKTKPQ